MIYSQILDPVLHEYGSRKNQFEFLRSLQIDLDNLRSGYQDQERLKCINYGRRETQACYLLAYLPPYLEQTEHALKRTAKKNLIARLLIEKRHLSLALLGCGPMPEALAISNLCRGSQLTITSIDIRAQLWRPAHTVTRKLIEKNCNILDHLAFDCDLGHPDSLPPERLKHITNADIVIAQNCCNELDELQRSQFARHLQRVLADLRPGSILLINDIADEAVSIMNQVLASPYIPKHYQVILDDRFSTKQHITVQAEVPLVLERNLFLNNSTMRLSARKSIYYRALSVIRKETD